MAKVYLAYSLMGRLSLFLASAFGTVLATIGTNTKYVAVTVAVSTAVSRWLFSTMVEEQRENYERAVSELTCAKLLWEALPNEQRSQQAMRDRLVLNVEGFIEACLPPQTSMLRVKDEAPQSKPADIGVTTKNITMEFSPTEKASPCPSSTLYLRRGCRLELENSLSAARPVASLDSPVAYEATGASQSGVLAWNGASWVASTGPSTIISAALWGFKVYSSPETADLLWEKDESMEAARALARGSRNELRAKLESGGVLDKLADMLHDSAQKLLADEVDNAPPPKTAAELTSKFVNEGTNTLSFGGIKTFLGGLEARVGTPRPDVQAAMQREHCNETDSVEPFTASNYGITTTSRTEWWFAFNPKEGLKKLALATWPSEDPSRLPHIKAARKPEPLGALSDKLAHFNGKLAALGREVSQVELLAAKLYTGPMFIKYNAVLRGNGSSVEFLLKAFESSCQGNTYTTTIHAINSCVVKMSQLTMATKVYRGNADIAPPDAFLTADEFGVKGGVEFGFMSSTLEAKVARHYADRPGKMGLVFEIQQGMVSRGADISPFSQYPHEKEVLFPPLTGLEVESNRVEGEKIVLQVRPNIQMGTRTIEEVIARRLTLLRDMSDGMKIELASGAALAKRSPDGRDAVLLLLSSALDAEPLAQLPEAYNEDSAFLAAVKSALQIKNDLAADPWAGAESAHLPLYYALQLFATHDTAPTQTAVGDPSSDARLPSALLASAPGMVELAHACRTIQDAMIVQAPRLWELSTQQADAIAEAGREVRRIDDRRALAAQWAQVQGVLAESVAGDGSSLTGEQLQAAVRNGLRCELPREKLEPAIKRLWRQVDTLIGAATRAEPLSKIIGDAVGAGLSEKLAPAIEKLAHLYAKEGRGIPIFVDLPLGPALNEVLAAFRTHSGLRKLILKSCALDQASVAPLANFLSAGPPHMYEAYLNGNPALGAHAGPLFEALAANRRAGLALSAVAMPECGITDGAAEALARLLEAGEVSLVELNLKDNALSEAMKEQLRQANACGHVQSLQL